MSYLPSKNFIAPVSAIFVIIFTWWFITRVMWEVGGEKLEREQNTAAEKNKVLAMDSALDKAFLDTDEDGLNDMDEILWKTDTKKKDTDEDGVPDGEEVKSGRDPAIARKALPDGSWSDELKKPEKSEDPANGTVTGQFVEDFMKKYMGSKTAIGGAALPEKVKAELVNSATADLQKNTASYKDEYARKDIKISKTADPKKYLNDLAKALDKNFKNISESELAIAESFSDTRDPEKLETLSDYIYAYKAIIDFMKNEQVPLSYSDLHLELLNSMQNTMFAVQNMQRMPLDPILGIIGTNLYYKEAGRARRYLIALKTQTEADKIVFNENETGSFFNQYFAKIK